MMKKYVAQILSTNIDSNGIRITEEAIDDFLKNQKIPIPVTVDFNGALPVGHSVSFKKLENGIECSFVVRDEIPVLKWTHLVPKGIVKEEDYDHEEETIKNYELIELGLTNFPSDPTISEIREEEK